MQKNYSIPVLRIAECITALESHIDGITKTKFLRTLQIQDAVAMRIAIIGEIVKKLPASFLRKHSEIPWCQIAAMRNLIVHDYFSLNLEKIWLILREDLPSLKQKIQQFLQENPV
jgi:uncharacterized protein with HEPN domain